MTSLTLVRRIEARPSIVFEAVTQAEGMVFWFGPDGGPVISSESDARVGGRFRVHFRMLDGSEHICGGEYLEVKAPERVAMSWHWEGGVEDPGVSRIEIKLRPIPEGTELTLTHSLLHDEASCKSHQKGWTGSLDKLEHHFLISSKGDRHARA